MMVVLDKMEPWAAKISVDAIPARAVEWWGGGGWILKMAERTALSSGD